MDKRVEDALKVLWDHWSEYNGQYREEVMEKLDEAGFSLFGETGNLSSDHDGSVWFVFPGEPGGIPVILEDLSEKQIRWIKALAAATVKANESTPKFFKKDRPAVKRPSWVYPYHPEGWKIVAEKGPQHPKPQEPLVEDE